MRYSLPLSLLFCATIADADTQSASKAQSTEVSSRLTTPIGDSDKAWRMRETKRFVDDAYKPILELLNLTDVNRKKVYDLLVERTETIKDTEEVLHKKPATNDTRRAALKTASHAANADIFSLLDSNGQEIIRKMLDADRWLSLVAYAYVPELETAGLTLTPKQRFELALALRASFDTDVSPKARKRDELVLNAVGLTELDEEVLAALKDTLSSEQLFHIRNHLVIGNRKARQ